MLQHLRALIANKVDRMMVHVPATMSFLKRRLTVFQLHFQDETGMTGSQKPCIA